MPGASTGRFTDPENYGAHLRAMAVELVVTPAEGFDGYQTWVLLPHIDLLCAQESQPRVAYVSLQQPSLFITFLMQSKPAMLLNGAPLRPGEIALHASGERLHQRTTGAARWGLLAIAPRFALIYGTAVAGANFCLPPAGHVICRPSTDVAQFFRLIARVAHVAETHPSRIGHPEVARSLEQELIYALMTCLFEGEIRDESAATRRNADTLAQFEHQVALHLDRRLPISELCALIGTSERKLFIICAEFLGMSPSQYLLRRRLNHVRRVIHSVNRTTARVGAIARSQGFTELGRFAMAYRQAFGEAPSMTLRRIRNATDAGNPFL
jgi:AraC-like DNA-binding protein